MSPDGGRTQYAPEFRKALHAEVTGATLVIAKLDRLSRNAAFLLTLRDSGVRFAAVHLPRGELLTVGMALVAQAEREVISKRVKEALSVARSRGGQARQPPTAPRRLSGLARAERPSGRPSRGTPTGMPGTSRRSWRTSAPVGATSLRAIAAELNAHGMLTRRGGVGRSRPC